MTRPAMVQGPPMPASAVGFDPWRIFPARIAARREEVESVFTLDLEIEDEAIRRSYRFRPGQFNMLYVHGVGEAPVSICSPATRPEVIGHSIRIVGQVTHALARLAPGDVVGVRGPFGSWWPVDDAVERNLILVAGGIGLPPLRPVIERVLDERAKFGRVTLVYGAKTASGLMFTEQYDEWRDKGLELAVTVDWADASWRGRVARVPDVLRQMRPRGPETVVMACGPEIMMTLAAAVCLEGGVPEERVFVSMERNMKCAIGHCGHCQLGPEFICKDGPVFAYPKVKKFLMRAGF